MRTYIDKYRKQLLAIVMIILMIAFILPSAYKGPGGGRINRVLGHMGSTPVNSNDVAGYEQAWEVLNKYTRVQVSETQYVPAIQFALPYREALLLIRDHPEAFYLLAKEAESQGVIVTGDELNNWLENYCQVLDGNAWRAFNDVENDALADRIRSSIAQTLLVRKAFERASDVVKISAPIRRQVASQETDSGAFDVIEVPAAPFLASVPAPTPQQIEQQFKKYANEDGTDELSNPFGFGYKYPNRLKLQYVEIPLADIRTAAEKKRAANDQTQYEWDRDAFKYYQEHPDEFPTTAPDPANSIMALNPKPAPASPPAATTRPFADAKAEARKKVLEADVTKLAQRIQERLTAQMNGDFVAYRNALSTGGANAKIPTASVGAPYNTFEYLQRLAADVQKTFGVLPVIHSLEGNYVTREDMRMIPGLNQLDLENGAALSDYLFSAGAAFNPQAKDDTRLLKAFEPTPALHDAGGNAYIVRITDMQAAHAPASLAEVAPAVERDLRAAAAYEKAKAEATQLLAQARQSGGTLKSVSDATGRKIIPLPSVSFHGLANARYLYSPPPLSLPNPRVQHAFLRGAFDIFASATPSNPKPLGLIELPHDGRLFVAQLSQGQPQQSQPTDILALRDLLQAEAIRSNEYRLLILDKWFDYDDLAARLNYKPAAPPADDQNKAPTPNDDGPQNRPLL